MASTEDDEEVLLRKELRSHKAAVEATEQKLELLLKSRDSGGHRPKGTVFHLQVITDGVPEIIDPRDTVGAHLCGRKWSNFCFWAMYKNAPLAMLLSFVCGFCPLLFWLLSISVDPRFGWVCGLAPPMTTMNFSVYNRRLLYRLVTSFEWWAFFVLLCISMGTMIDAFAVDPPRTFGACCFLYGFGLASLSDARPLLRNQVVSIRALYLSWACLIWTALILWWLNKWILVRETVIPLGSVITLNVQSIGFSCFSSVAVLSTRYAWIANRDKTGGTMVMIKARVQYLPSNVNPSRDIAEANKVVASILRSNEGDSEVMKSDA